jgi:hypothetical protein
MVQNRLDQVEGCITIALIGFNILIYKLYEDLQK